MAGGWAETWAPPDYRRRPHAAASAELSRETRQPENIFLRLSLKKKGIYIIAEVKYENIFLRLSLKKKGIYVYNCGSKGLSDWTTTVFRDTSSKETS